ncbi:murein biosynthesis integral membrane protein MurJ [Patescibacteria group bacterium]|nr:murein biosynthesis integral membrane protein MurJ [Patescibacteria group bacterium]
MTGMDVSISYRLYTRQERLDYNKLAMSKMWTIFTKKQTSVGSAAFVLMLMVFASRVLGLVRDRFLSARFAPDELGVYFAAFRLPNLLFELLVMGALTAAFIPVYTKYISKQKEGDAQKMASVLINLGVCVLVLFSIPVMIWTEDISRLLAPGFTGAQIAQMAEFTRFMVCLQVTPLLVGNFFTGILQAHNYFVIPALAPVVYNIGIITGILLFSQQYGLWAPVIGVGIGAFFFMLIQLPLLLRVGYRHSLSVNHRLAGVKEVVALMGPRTFGLAVSQIDTTVDLMLATLLGARMVTIFNFAQHLQQLPVGLFGVTVAQAVLPTLSFQSAKENGEDFKRTILRSFHQILFLILPVSALFIVLRIPIVRLVFGASRFDWEATVLTGMTLSTFSISLFAQAAVQVLARGYYALYDTKTPVAVGVVSVLVNTLLSIVFVMIYKFPIWSLGLSASIASILNAVLLLIFLDKKIGHFSLKELLGPTAKMLIASVATGVALYVPLKLFDQLVFDTTRVFGLLLLTGIVSAIGLATYVLLSWVMGVGEVRYVWSLLRRVRRAQPVLLEPASEVVNGGMESKVS